MAHLVVSEVAVRAIGEVAAEASSAGAAAEDESPGCVAALTPAGHTSIFGYVVALTPAEDVRRREQRHPPKLSLKIESLFLRLLCHPPAPPSASSVTTYCSSFALPLLTSSLLLLSIFSVEMQLAMQGEQQGFSESSG